jgi:hypothetical protein
MASWGSSALAACCLRYSGEASCWLGQAWLLPSAPRPSDPPFIFPNMYSC